MKFTFESHGKLIFGMPYVAKIKLDIDNTLKREYIESKADILTNGEVDVKVEYEAENFEIIEERHGSFGPDVLASYSIAYRNKLITLGDVSDKEIENKIIMYLDNDLSIGILLNSIDELIKEQFEDEINEILNKDKQVVNTDKINYLDLASALKKFIENNEYIMLQFSDFHVIFESEYEKIIMKFINDNNIYAECQNFKVNIMLDKVENYEIYNSKYEFSRINIFMKDGATISLIQKD